MKTQLVNLLARKDYTPSNVPQLLERLGLAPQQQQTLQKALKELLETGEVVRIKGNRYLPSNEANLVAGRISVNRQGKGFLQPDDPSAKEIIIHPSDLSTALHGDRVVVRREIKPQGLAPRTRADNVGAVVRILERNRTQIVGTLQHSRQFLYVIPDDPRIPHDIYVPLPRDTGRPARPGDKVVVELQSWESRHTNPEGTIIEVLGPPDAEGVDMLSVLRQYRLPLRFPKKALSEARSIGDKVTAKDREGRRDCRAHSVITIDPDDAKDFDDAFFLERTSPQQWKLWVHIADVSHYVKPGSALDQEARKRGNSTYLVDRVIPMLPEALSNELCSLKPDMDRLTRCVEFTLSNDGRVQHAEFYPAVIHSQRRFTYREAFEVLQAKPQGPIECMLHEANALAQRIRRFRFKAGSLELDFPETKIYLDDAGQIARIEKVENDISHQLIEEFMLLANEAVAGHLMRQRRTAIFRVHEKPDEERLGEYREEVLSRNVPCGNLTNPREVQKLLRRLNGLTIGEALKISFLRSLKRARYAVQPLGHYGLAKSRYTHFTSPIRRYADLVVHRLLASSGHSESRSSLEKTAAHISLTERNSADAERDSRDVKLYAFLRAQLKSGKPNRYAARVTDIRSFGFFVEVPGLGMSGLVHLSSFENDFYLFNAVRNELVGRVSKRAFRLGDSLEVQVAKVDTFKKQVDFRCAQAERRNTRPASTEKRSGGPQQRRSKGGNRRRAATDQRGKKRGSSGR